MLMSQIAKFSLWKAVAPSPNEADLLTQATERTFMHVIWIHKHTAHTDESRHDTPAKDPGRDTGKRRDIAADPTLGRVTSRAGSHKNGKEFALRGQCFT